MLMLSSLRPVSASLLATAVLAAAAIVPAAPAVAQPAPEPANPHVAAAHAAGEWLADQLVDGGIPGFVGTDWGLTVDALVALEVTGADPAAATQVTDALAANVDAYATGGDFAPDLRFGGPTAKLLYAAVVADADPTDFGGHDLRARTLALVAGADLGAQQGWVKNHDGAGLTGGGNMFDQSLAVLGLARTGAVPQPVVDFLVSQQCPEGGFRVFPPADGTPCTTTGQIIDPDTTGMAVMALQAAEAAGATGVAEPIQQAVAWLLAAQRPSGAFHGSAFTDFPNTNSTGLGGIALAATGETEAAGRAADWVAGNQLSSTGGGAAAAHAGAIAYTPDDFNAAVADGIAEFGLDQWRRSTAQAVLVLAGIPLADAGLTDPAVPSPPASPPPPASGTPTPTPGQATPDPAAPGAGGGLPVTGAPAAGLVALGAAAVVVGAVLLGLAGWRRRES